MKFRFLSDYSFHFIFSSCESSNEKLVEYDGTSFDRMDDAIKFLLMSNDDNCCIMVYKEFLNHNGTIFNSECVDNIYINDLC